MAHVTLSSVTIHLPTKDNIRKAILANKQSVIYDYLELCGAVFSSVALTEENGKYSLRYNCYHYREIILNEVHDFEPRKIRIIFDSDKLNVADANNLVFAKLKNILLIEKEQYERSICI